jgi:hypothetical protein
MPATEYPNKIFVFWDGEVETVDISAALNPGATKFQTSGLWAAERTRVNYRVTCEVVPEPAGTRVLNIRYEPDLNRHLAKYEVVWGDSQISVKRGEDSGLALWRTKGGDKWFRRKWKSVSSCLSQPRTIETVNRYARRQAVLRKELSDYEDSCVICGESTTDALQAAHIVSVAGQGADTVFNAVLMRADIHRLYDERYFVINRHGRIVVKKKVGRGYSRFIRSGRALPRATLERIREALLLRDDA